MCNARTSLEEVRLKEDKSLNGYFMPYLGIRRVCLVLGKRERGCKVREARTG